MPDLERRDIYVSNLQMALDEGEHGLSAVPGHIKKIIEEDMWQDRIVQATGERAQYDDFTEFIADSPPDGLGTDVDMLRRMCEESPEALRLLREVVKSQGERTDLNDNIIEVNESETGTSKDYTLDRLAREDAELYEQVVQGEMSANAAAIEAGFRTKTVSVPVHKGGEPQVSRAAESLAKHFDGALPDLIQELQRHA